MRLGYKFANLCGSVYTCGNVLFTSDNTRLLSPVGNRLTVFDLQRHSSKTFSWEARKNIAVIALSADDRTLMVVDEDGRAMTVNMRTGLVMQRINFKKAVTCLKISPCSQFVAVSHGHHVQVWKMPNATAVLRPFEKHRTFTGHYSAITCIDWSADSQWVATGSEDMTVRLYSRDPVEGFVPITLSGHRSTVVGVFWRDGIDGLWTVARDGAFFVWRWEAKAEAVAEAEMLGEDVEEVVGPRSDNSERYRPKKRRRWQRQMRTGGAGEWVLRGRHFLQVDHAKIYCCSAGASLATTASLPLASTATNSGSKAITDAAPPGHSMLVVGFSSGVFGLYSVGASATDQHRCEYDLVHTLTVSQNRLSTCAITNSGSWLALGSAQLGQLLVWEWESETYVLKQQGHFADVNAVEYSADGQVIVTGGEDGKVKLWRASTGFCFTTFGQHTAPVKALAYVQSSNAIISASLDGTVRAFDLFRYRNFRTMTTPTPVQFLSVAVDTGGEVVAAGAMEPPEIYVWSLQTGRLIDVLSGHDGPVSCLSFSPRAPVLASASWDKTVRLWEPYKNTAALETLKQEREVLALAWRPDGQQLCVSTLKGELAVWDTKLGNQISAIEGRSDVTGGRLSTSRRSAVKSAAGKSFTSVCYSADGQCVLAGGRSKYVCLYEVSQGLLLRKWQLSHNRSLDGVLDKLNSGLLTEAGVPLDAMDVFDEDEDIRLEDRLPGAVKAGANSRRRARRAEVRARAVKFSPTGQAWACGTASGLQVYALDHAATFAPMGLEIDVTPDAVIAASRRGEHGKALLMALHLGLHGLLRSVYDAVPSAQVPLVAASIPEGHLPRLLPFVARQLQESPRLQFGLCWSMALLQQHGQFMRKHTYVMLPHLRNLQKIVRQHQDDLSALCSGNTHLLRFLLALPNVPASEVHVIGKGIGTAVDLLTAETSDADEDDGEDSGMGSDSSGDWAAPTAEGGIVDMQAA